MALKRSELYTLNASIGSTEYSIPNGGTTLQNITTPAVVSVLLDVSAVEDADEYRVRVKEKIVSGGTQRTIVDFRVKNKQQSSLILIPPLILMHGYDITVVKVAGTDRTLTGRVEVSTGPNITELFGRSDTSVTDSGYSIVNGSTTPAASTSAAIIQAICHDRANMVKGDEFQLSVMEKAIAGGTQRKLIQTMCACDVQVGAAFITPLLQVRNGWDVLNDRTAGSNRNWDMSIRGMT